ncbi:MAG: SDR family NAD(P)-dependent oxidoreductase [bacterium]|nr:SDR family NAD(P)-dependent oxidoreductase [bacterium]
MSEPSITANLDGQVALVTGATSGLGRRFANLIADCGAKVALAGRRVERLEEVAKEIEARGGTAVPFPLDMTDAEAVKAAPGRVEELLGAPVQVLVNNAGVPDAQRAHKMSLDLINTVFDTNLRGPWILACEVGRRLIELKRPGRIVNISSVGATSYSGIGAALYSVTKSAVIRMTEVLGVEWARYEINVTGIAPGSFESEMMDGMLERMGDLAQAFPRKRIGKPEQLDSTMLYLLSPASEMVTGTVVIVDDGQMPR